ncbi:MAG: hypothetical protein LBJ01_12085, partial [Tannerella sp.]|nr:hypothetical protein [Tannerella sp.]
QRPVQRTACTQIQYRADVGATLAVAQSAKSVQSNPHNMHNMHNMPNLYNMQNPYNPYNMPNPQNLYNPQIRATARVAPTMPNNDKMHKQ